MGCELVMGAAASSQHAQPGREGEAPSWRGPLPVALPRHISQHHVALSSPSVYAACAPPLTSCSALRECPPHLVLGLEVRERPARHHQLRTAIGQRQHARVGDGKRDVRGGGAARHRQSALHR
eukprot:6286464-Prymnesium_polylepis.1